MFNIFTKYKEYKKYNKLVKAIKKHIRCLNSTREEMFAMYAIRELATFIDNEPGNRPFFLSRAMLNLHIELSHTHYDTFMPLYGDTLTFSWAWSKYNREHYISCYNRHKGYFKNKASKMLEEGLDYADSRREKIETMHLKRIIEDNLTPYYITHLINRNNEEKKNR